LNERLEHLKFLLEQLRNEAEELLKEHSIWDVSAYGWQDADTPDADYGGIAMWEMNPPFEHDWGTLLEGRTPKYAPSKRDEVLLKSGENLIATMMFARRSLGMALCFAAVSQPDVVGGNDEFWQEYATTLMWLNIASDRLRDFFLMARFGQIRDQYHDAYRKAHNPKDYRVPYSAPFKAPTEDVAINLRSCLEELSGLSENLQDHRRDRGDRVHEIATMSAQRSMELLHEQNRLASKTKNPKDLLFHDESLPPAIEAMKLWFGRLIKATSLALSSSISIESSPVESPQSSVPGGMLPTTTVR
jgi:hypothetical protein